MSNRCHLLWIWKVLALSGPPLCAGGRISAVAALCQHMGLEHERFAARKQVFGFSVIRWGKVLDNTYIMAILP